MYLDNSVYARVQLAWQFVTQNSTIADRDKEGSQHIEMVNSKAQRNIKKQVQDGIHKKEIRENLSMMHNTNKLVEE